MTFFFEKLSNKTMYAARSYKWMNEFQMDSFCLLLKYAHACQRTTMCEQMRKENKSVMQKILKQNSLLMHLCWLGGIYKMKLMTCPPTPFFHSTV